MENTRKKRKKNIHFLTARNAKTNILNLPMLSPNLLNMAKKRVAIPCTVSTGIQLSKEDLSTPVALGRKVLRELNNISQQVFNRSGQEVLTETPRSKLIFKPTVKEEENKYRKK